MLWESTLPEPKRPRRRHGVYPRVCGGARSWEMPDLRDYGLSPRVRGSRYQRAASRDPIGSIPACAGEPQTVRVSTSMTRVYPRVCGGAFLRDMEPLLDEGLSPRVRGSQERRSRACPWRGSIPACAGEPTVGAVTFRFHGVYPRVCGGAAVAGDAVDTDSGLSPRVRGSRRPPHRPRPRARSIPACAGEPRPGGSSRAY